MVVFGLVSVTAFYLVLIYAFRTSSVAVGTLLLYLAPALITIGASLWLNDPLTRTKIEAMILSFAGCFLIVEAFRPGTPPANLAGIGFAVRVCGRLWKLQVDGEAADAAVLRRDVDGLISGGGRE